MACLFLCIAELSLIVWKNHKLLIHSSVGKHFQFGAIMNKGDINIHAQFLT